MPINKKETLRYLGYGRNTPSAAENALIDQCTEMLDKTIKPKATILDLPLILTENKIVIENLIIESAALYKSLTGCERVYLFAATLGREADMLIRRESAVNMAKAAVLQAAAASAIEEYCNTTCSAIKPIIKERGLHLRPRFSPGYGDFSLSHQADILRIINAQKIGLSCTDSFMLVPSKSVTAIIGLSKTPCRGSIPCADCDKTDCEFKRGAN